MKSENAWQAGKRHGKRSTALLVFLVAPICFVLADPGGERMDTTGTAAELQVILRYVSLDGSNRDALDLDLELYNPTDEPISFLPWHTPLEGYRNHFMHVLNRVGHETAYRGKMVDRERPDESDYRTIAPGERMTARFDLLEAYPVTETGAYSIQFFGGSTNELRDSNVLFFALDETGAIERSPVTVELQLPSAIVATGDPVWIDFAVQNTGMVTVPFLPWYTPLEAMPTRCFEVKGPTGERIQYLSLMIDRPAPKPTDYIQIRPGERRMARVDLQPLYRFGSGVYTLRYLWIGEDFAAIYPLSVHIKLPESPDGAGAAGPGI